MKISVRQHLSNKLANLLMPFWTEKFISIAASRKMRWFVCVPRFFLKSRRLCVVVSLFISVNVMLDSSRLGRQVGGMADDYDSGVRIPDHSNFDKFECCPSVIVTSSSLGKGGTRTYLFKHYLTHRVVG
jgi:hypothetical protein